MKRAEAEQKTLQSKEWKEAAKEIRKEVEADIKQRPDVAADLLIGSGELGGKQLEMERTIRCGLRICPRPRKPAYRGDIIPKTVSRLI